MSRTDKYQSAFILGTTLALVAAYGLADVWMGALLVALVGGGWWALRNVAWQGTGALAFAVMLAAAAYAAWLDLSIYLVLPGVVFGLSAWDLGHFEYRLRQRAQTELTARLERDHIRRLLLLDGAALALFGVAQVLQVRLNLGLALFSGLLLAWSLSKVVSMVRQKEE